MKEFLEQLKSELDGTLESSTVYQKMYATDASVYRKTPLAVAFPKTKKDLFLLLDFAREHQTSLTLRSAGTSLAGQCVNDGIIVDVSRYMNQILSINEDQKTVTVQPGVVRDALNETLKKYGLFFGPNTSTSNRCMIGGMVGNNSSGTTSIQYGVTRDKIVAMECILADKSVLNFTPMSSAEFVQKVNLDNKEGELYSTIDGLLHNESIRKQITKEFPKPTIHRRNTGYAIDLLANSELYGGKKPFSLTDLLCGSEGTLAITTSITLKLDALPPAHAKMVATHYRSINDCLNDVKNVMQHQLFTCEMMDKTILDCTKNNRTQQRNRFFIEGDPEAILMLEVRANSEAEVDQKVAHLLQSIGQQGLSYAQPVLSGDEIHQALELRKAGLGLLGNIVGDKKAVACIEDTAVALDDLAPFIAEFSELMKKYNQSAVYYAHAGAGELHLRPTLNLKKSQDVAEFESITTSVAQLTKKYGGSFSGEHGDGIVRSSFLPLMIGEANYELCRQIKTLFDPDNILNPGKIIDAYSMTEGLRYEVDRAEPTLKTKMDFSDSAGYLRAIEKCNGSGDCRKDVFAGGTMCPSYRATKDEKDVTRGRANVLREVLTNSEQPFTSEEVRESLALCLSCKACASECPSSIDMAAYKAEYLHQYHLQKGTSRSERFFANNTKNSKKAARFPKMASWVMRNKTTSNWIKKRYGIHANRSLPPIHRSVKAALREMIIPIAHPIKTVYLFVDEFSEYLDGDVAKDTVTFLGKLNYQVQLVDHAESGRSFISKGFLDQAEVLANKNIALFAPLLSAETPLLGIEPSAILTFRDEYIRLAKDKAQAEHVKSHSFLLEEFIAQEIAQGHITSKRFSDASVQVKIHNHCHQKALSNQKHTYDILNLPKNFTPSIIPSGCCGMAGSFGYEKDHYNVSMTIGEHTLFPAVRATHKNTYIIANGTSCRHQIKDGTQREALHWVSLLKNHIL